MHAAPSTGRPPPPETKASMRNKLREFRHAGCHPVAALGGGIKMLLLLSLMLITGARASWPPGTVEILGEGTHLEASMHSTLLSDLQEAQAAVSSAVQPGGYPDSSAVVGRLFQMEIPVKRKDGGSKVKVRVDSLILFQSIVCF